MNENRNPVYKYTVLGPQNDKDPRQSSLLRANITSDTIRCGGNSATEGETGLVIVHLIGGLKEPHNIVPLSAKANRNLRKFENTIYK